MRPFDFYAPTTVVEALTYYLIRPECHEEARALLAREMRRS